MNRLLTLFVTFLCLSLPNIGQTSATHASFNGRVLEEINLARSQPQRYADYLRQMRGGFQGNSYRIPGSPYLLKTTEGSAAVDEAIRFLERQRPLPVLSWSPGLAAAADELAREQAEDGSVGHVGTGSGGMRQRIERQGRWKGRIGENIAYGSGNPRGMVMQLIINDGVPDRGHRRNLFRRSFAAAGVACAPHSRFGSLCVMDFAARFLD